MVILGIFVYQYNWGGGIQSPNGSSSGGEFVEGGDISPRGESYHVVKFTSLPNGRVVDTPFGYINNFNINPKCSVLVIDTDGLVVGKFSDISNDSELDQKIGPKKNQIARKMFFTEGTVPSVIELTFTKVK